VAAKKKKKNKRKKGKNRKNSRNSSLIGKIRRIGFNFFSFFRKMFSDLPGKIKRYTLSSFMFLLGFICFLSFFNLAGIGGEVFREFLFVWIGKAAFFVPLIFIFFGLIFLFIPKKLFFAGFLSTLFVLIGLSGIFSLFESNLISGGRIGSSLAIFLKNLFGDLVSFFVFLALIIVGILSGFYIFSSFILREKEQENFVSKVIKKVMGVPEFKVSKVEPEQDFPKPEEKPQDSEIFKRETEKVKIFKFTPPPLSLLEEEQEKAQSGDIKQNALVIKKTLENFGIEVSMAEVNIGPTVTQYTLKPQEGVKLSKITGLTNNLSLNLAAHPIRIEAPIPGKSLVGIEIPNKVRSKVRLRDLLSSPNFKKDSSTLVFALGRDVSGNPEFSDISRLPHLLIAGATGTGKTIFLNSLVLSLLYQNSPETLRLVLIDPKRVEFRIYGDLPHLAFPTVFDPQNAVNALSWLVDEMEKRFNQLSDAKVKDIFSFNEQAQKKKEPLLPWIVIVIDELADLMAARGKEIEARIVRIAQMARAVGIHLVIATQRPSVEVLTGLIKANITSRVSFQVASHFDSRTVLDAAGAEKLLGLGDMLHISAESVKPRRIQGAYVSEKEVKRIVDWVKENTITELPEKDLLLKSYQQFLEEKEALPGELKTFDDPLYEEAREVVIRSKKASASLLQRRLQIGYARAARLLDMLEVKGVVGPARGSKPRKVFIQPEEPSQSAQTEEYEGDYFE